MLAFIALCVFLSVLLLSRLQREENLLENNINPETGDLVGAHVTDEADYEDPAEARRQAGEALTLSDLPEYIPYFFHKRLPSCD